jgi:hypothetical protein
MKISINITIYWSFCNTFVIYVNNADTFRPNVWNLIQTFSEGRDDPHFLWMERFNFVV